MSIRKYEQIGLSNQDISELIWGRANIVVYGDICMYRTIEQLMGPNNACFLLYEVKPKYGHWCLIFKRCDGVIEFFDPYGTYVDDELDYISKSFRNESNQAYPHLSRLLFNYKGKMEYNEYPFQKEGNDIRTCGRWCVVRLWYRCMNLEEFRDVFLSDNGDKIVTYLTKWVNQK